ncbi:hypothetical protein [Lentzea terrae]|uniref:hypothetical protein n=1 Tax=Lentzea terrae TaxID=2200761 RepID=UPI001E361D07|nr:hypothetical protein [Lentzea terrae]
MKAKLARSVTRCSTSKPTAVVNNPNGNTMRMGCTAWPAARTRLRMRDLLSKDKNSLRTRRTQRRSGYPRVMDTDRLRRYVLNRLDEDEQRLAEEKLPLLDEAERRGRLRIIRSDDGSGLLLLPGPIQAPTERVPVPFPEKFALLRTEVEQTSDEALLRLLAAAYDTHHDWQEEWR